MLFLLFHCSSNTTPVEKGIQTKTFLFGNQTEPQELDPHIVTGVPEFHILQSLFEGLVILEPAKLEPVPGMAARWEINLDGTEYTFHLRPDARWSNGDTLTADDFVFSYKRILSPALGSEYAYMLHCVKNAEAYNKGELGDFDKVGFTAVDDTTLRIVLARPTPHFITLLAHHSWYPVHPPTILKHGRIDARGTGWTQPGNLVGNGPFVLAEWEINRWVIVKKNTNYWDAPMVKLEEIRFYPIENVQTEERTFRTGGLHVSSQLAPEKIDWYLKNDSTSLRRDPYLGTYYYVFNIKKPPFDQPLVRKAFACAVDRESIVNHLLKGGQQPAVCFTPRGTGGYSCDSLVGYNPAEAIKMLDSAGYGPGKKQFPPVELLYNTSETHHLVAQAIQQMWKSVLSVEVTLVNQEWKVYLASRQQGDFGIVRMGWIADYNDPMSFLDLWVKDGGNNNSGWSDAGYDSLIRSAGNTQDIGARMAAFRNAEKILLDQLPVIPIYFYTNVYLLHTSVRGWSPNILNMHHYKFVSLEK